MSEQAGLFEEAAHPIHHVTLVTGSRLFDDFTSLDKALNDAEPDMVIHGAALGADSMAEAWARRNQVMYLAVPARWNEYGKRAGPIRNKAMLEILLDMKESGATVNVLAFPIKGKSVGTYHMIRIAEEAGVIVHVVI